MTCLWLQILSEEKVYHACCLCAHSLAGQDVSDALEPGPRGGAEG